MFVLVLNRAPELKEHHPDEVPKSFQALYHKSSRNLLYPSGTATRFPVPDEKVPWEVGLFHTREQNLVPCRKAMLMLRGQA